MFLPSPGKKSADAHVLLAFSNQGAFSQKTNSLKIIAHFLPNFDKKIYGLFGNSIFSLKVLNFMKNMIKHQL
jgi:hypothetical protein